MPVGPRHYLALLLLLPVLVLWVRPAHALCTLCTCTASTTGVAFGAYVSTNPSTTTATGSVRVDCSLSGIVSLTVSYSIEISAGNGTFASRKLTGPSGPALLYNLYTTSGGNAVWGDGTAGTQTVSDSYLLALLGGTRTYPVYGVVPANQIVAAGNFNDTLVVTVTY